jgi:hypothetical protein
MLTISGVINISGGIKYKLQGRPQGIFMNVNCLNLRDGSVHITLYITWEFKIRYSICYWFVKASSLGYYYTVWFSQWVVYVSFNSVTRIMSVILVYKKLYLNRYNIWNFFAPHLRSYSTPLYLVYFALPTHLMRYIPESFENSTMLFLSI